MKFMRSKTALLGIALLVFSSTAFASVIDQLASDALSTDTVVSSAAISELRAMGPVGLDAMFVRYAADIDRFTASGVADDKWPAIAGAIDAVAMQKDAYASHLYWYTDLDEAKKAAKAKSKPILTLRLLGDLNKEFSCANSRLFRAVLYPNAQVSKYLRDNYILHWKSVRPAPRITIDFGDGRKIERTVTGNSIHYILDQDGQLVDALPGLYSPKAFLKYLKQARQVGQIVSKLPNDQRYRALLKYRKMSYDEIKLKREKAVAASNVQLKESPFSTAAIIAGTRAAAKMVIVDEAALLRVYDDFAKFEPQIDFGDWSRLGELYSPSKKLDANSIAFIRRQNLNTGLSETEFKALFERLDEFISIDTTRNDFIYHAKLYELLNLNWGPVDLEDLNARVYDQIFRTPNTDKWLGLYSSDVYTALDGNGLIK
jgi:hypothetical protein